MQERQIRELRVGEHFYFINTSWEVLRVESLYSTAFERYVALTVRAKATVGLVPRYEEWQKCTFLFKPTVLVEVPSCG